MFFTILESGDKQITIGVNSRQLAEVRLTAKGSWSGFILFLQWKNTFDSTRKSKLWLHQNIIMPIDIKVAANKKCIWDSN